MSILHTVSRFFSSLPTVSVQADSSATPVAEQKQFTPPVNDWALTTGRLRGSQQERNVTYRNSEITGTCVGKVEELTGSVLIGLFEDLPTWLPSLLIRVTMQIEEGELTVSLRERNGTIVSVTAPGAFEGDAELTDGRVWLRCESGSAPARHIRYEVVII